MHIRIKSCLDFFMLFLLDFSMFSFRFAFQYISLRFVIFRFVSFRLVRCVSISFRSLVQPIFSSVFQEAFTSHASLLIVIIIKQASPLNRLCLSHINNKFISDYSIIYSGRHLDTNEILVETNNTQIGCRRSLVLLRLLHNLYFREWNLYVLVVKIQEVFIIFAFSRKKVRKMNKKKSDRQKKNPQAKSP